MNILQEMLLIQDPSIFRLYGEMTNIATFFIAPVFTIALILEYFGDMDFGGVIKKLLLITVFIGAFYQFHTKATAMALDSASYTLKKVSPRNLFVKKWYEVKVRTAEKKEWNFIQSIVVPNLNDLLATAFYLFAQVWLLKLIYSTVYHFTYVFSGITAILYFLGWTKDALKGTVQASLWCMIMPFVIVAILALVGNSIDDLVLGSELMVTKVNTIVWLFGVTLLLLISPLITFGMIKGDGVHSFGSKMGTMLTSTGMKAMALTPIIAASLKSATGRFGKSDGESLLGSSIRGSLRKERKPELNKMKLSDKHGENKKSPAVKKSLNDEKLKTTVMAKDESTNLSRSYSGKEQVHNQKAKTENFEEKKAPQETRRAPKESSMLGSLKPIESRNNESNQDVRLQKENFKFNQRYWDDINPHKAEAIKKKYGIEGNKVDPNKVYRPVRARPARSSRKEKLNEL